MHHTSMLVTLAGASALALGLSACAGTSSNAGGGSGSGSSSSASTAVQFVNPLPKYPAWRTIGDCMAKEAKKRGIDLTETGPTGQALDATTMITQIQQAIANKKAGIITLPASDAFAALLKQAQSKGIVTATMYGDGSAGSGADINVGLDWTKLGQLYVDTIAARPGEQRVGLVAAGSTGIGKSWMDGVKAAAATTTNVKIVGEVYTGDDSSKALSQVSALLTAHPDVNVVTTHMGTVTPGAVAALKAKGLTDKVAFIGNGPDNGGKEALDNGTEYRALVQSLCTSGRDAIDSVAERIKKKETSGGTPQLVTVGTKMADKSDIATLMSQGWR